MGLLEEIQNEAVDTKSDLGALLRKCKLLASRLGSKPLEDWLVWESNGYPKDVKVPEYRVWPLQIKGHFAGPFGSGLNYAPVPLAFLPEKIREHYLRYECKQSVASIESILAKAEGGTVNVTTGDLALLVGTKVYRYQNCIQAWAEFSTSHLVELLNSVRNRTLDFALALWKEQPEVGEAASGNAKTIDSSRVTQIFNTTILGGSAQLVGTATESNIISVAIGTKDFSSLERLLRENGVAESDLTELRVAVEAETEPVANKGFGPRVSSWIAQMVKKAAEGSWDVGVGAAGTLLAQALAKYYGL